MRDFRLSNPLLRPTFGLAALLLAGGCAQPLPMVGEWIGDKGIPVSPSQHTEIDTTMERVELTIKPEGYFTLVDKSFPYEGRLDLTAKSQKLDIQAAMGMSVQRMPASARPDYTLIWEGDDALRVRGAGTDVVLHRKPKPPTG